jgi:2-keto-4-pentenoate hydratase/2-oxohepta-3-ene-1,7-dioic acid hydratase in catechol pathway
MASFFRTGRKCIAIGRNYVDHAKELGNAVPKGMSRREGRGILPASLHAIIS